MDPITGIGLAASVIQLVTFSIDAVRTLRDVYETGSVSRYDSVGYTTDKLASLTQSLQQGLQDPLLRSSTLNKDEQDLIDLAGKCQDCAHRLQHEVRYVYRVFPFFCYA